MEEGKRLENLSWRVFSQESFALRNQAGDRPSSLPPRFTSQSHNSSESVPDLSSSLESNASSARQVELSTLARPLSAPPALRRTISSASRKDKPIDLEKIVNSIKEKTALGPLSPLPASLSPKQTASAPQPAETQKSPQVTPKRAGPATVEMATAPRLVPDSSSSTVATTITASDLSEMSPRLMTSGSASTDISATSVVHGFSKDHVSSCYRSHTQLAPTPTQSLLRSSPMSRTDMLPKKKVATKFIVGGSSGEDGDSLESRYLTTRSSLSEGLRRSNHAQSAKKATTSFKEEISRLSQDKAYESEGVFEESEDEEDEEDDGRSESAIDDDDDVEEEDWEDEDDEPGSPRQSEGRELFQRVDSRANLTSRRSLLTSQLHEKDRASALQAAASSAVARRSRATSPNGPTGSPSALPPSGLRMQASHARPIMMNTSSPHQAALSPRTTRRNMLQTELTESLRKHLIWERQVRGSTTNAVLKRRHTSNDVKNLREYPGTTAAAPPAAYIDQNNNANASSWNNYFDTGLQEYHQKGW